MREPAPHYKLLVLSDDANARTAPEAAARECDRLLTEIGRLSAA